MWISMAPAFFPKGNLIFFPFFSLQLNLATDFRWLLLIFFAGPEALAMAKQTEMVPKPCCQQWQLKNQLSAYNWNFSYSKLAGIGER